MSNFVAFLRGINVNRKTVQMKVLTEELEKAGYSNVRTLLASGNVIFESDKSDLVQHEQKIQDVIKQRFGFNVVVQVRNIDEIKQIVEENPFKNQKADKDFHWYVTFLNNPVNELPASNSGFFELLSISHNTVFSILNKTKGKTTDFMTYMDKQFGKEVTTRNWNTILKVIK